MSDRSDGPASEGAARAFVQALVSPPVATVTDTASDLTLALVVEVPDDAIGEPPLTPILLWVGSPSDRPPAAQLVATPGRARWLSPAADDGALGDTPPRGLPELELPAEGRRDDRPAGRNPEGKPPASISGLDDTGPVGNCSPEASSGAKAAAPERAGVAIGDADSATDPPPPRPFRSLLTALLAARGLINSEPGPRRVIAVIDASLPESADALASSFMALAEAGVGVDLVVAGGNTESANLTRLVGLGAGQLWWCGDHLQIAGTVAKVVEAAHRPVVRRASLELTIVPQLQPLRLFRIAPAPAHLGAVRVGDGERRLRLNLGPLAVGQRVIYLLTGSFARRRVGTYRVGLARLMAGDGERAAKGAVSAALRVTADPAEAGLVDARVRFWLDLVEPLAWLDDIVRAQSDGEARRAAAMLERTVRHFAALEARDAAADALELRLAFLRSGQLDRDHLARLRRAAIQLASGG